MSWMRFNNLTKFAKVISEAEDAASVATKMKMAAQAGGMSGAQKMLTGMGDFGKTTWDGMYASKKLEAIISGPLQQRVLEDVMPLSKNPITNNLMFTDMVHLREQKMTIFDNNLRRARELTPGETTAYLRAKYTGKPSSNSMKYNDAWDEVQKRTEAMGSIFDDLHAEADTYAKQYAPGTPLEYLENYYVHSYEYDRLTKDEFFIRYLEQFAKDRKLFDAYGDPDILEAKRIYERDIAPNSKFIAENLLMKRTADMPGYDMSPIALMNYIDDAAKQMAEWRYLGEDYNKLNGWLDGIEQDAGVASREWAEYFVNENLGRLYTKTKPGRVAQDIGTIMQQMSSLILSYFSVFRNAFQSQFTAFATDLPSYGKGIARVFKDPSEAMKFAETSRATQLQLPKEMIKSWPGRIYKGTITDFWAGEMGFAQGTGFTGLIKNTLNGLQQWHYKTIGMNTTERFNRSISANSAIEYLDELFEAAKGNQKWYTYVGGKEGAIKRMRELIDMPDESLTDKLLAMPHKTLEGAIEAGDHTVQNLIERSRAFAAWQVTDDTQYGLSGRMRLPLFMQHPVGKFLMQFKTFSYRSMQMMWQAAKSNPKAFLLTAIPLLPAMYLEGQYVMLPLMKLLYPGNKRDEDDPGTFQRVWEAFEPLAIMGIGDMFFEMIRDFAETGDATKAVGDFFAQPIAVKKARQFINVTLVNRWKKIVDWDYDFKKYFDMTPSEKSQFIKALPWPGPANAIQMGASSLIKREAMKKEELDKIMRDFLQRSGVMTRPTTPPRQRRRQLERQFRERFR